MFRIYLLNNLNGILHGLGQDLLSMVNKEGLAYPRIFKYRKGIQFLEDTGLCLVCVFYHHGRAEIDPVSFGAKIRL